MKKYLLAAFLLVSSMSVCAQTLGASLYPLIPNDTTVLMGELPNGLTYYIKHNDYVPNRAAFHIAQKVGSIQEKPEQRGLAHFLEHMAFNGTRHYPGKNLIHYLETIGVKFGANLNAYTSVDETVYMITDVPTQRTTTIDSCLLILRDWSDGILLEGQAIDDERGVIEEEWRSRNSAFMRMLEAVSPQMYGTDKYADCMPIGNIEVIRNFQHDVIRDYYKTWYRPDLQGIVVVGDVDVKRTEQKIRELFADAKVPANAPKRVYYPVTPYDSIQIITSTDKEMTSGNIFLSQKIDPILPEMKQSVKGMQQTFIQEMATWMLQNRFSEILKAPNPPFAGANAYITTLFLSDKQPVFEISINAASNQLNKALTALLTERERMYRHGFTQAEYQRAKAIFLSQQEQQYNNRNQQNNRHYVQQCIHHFLDKDPIVPVEWGYTTWQQIAQTTSVQQINDWLSTHNPNNSLLWLLGDTTAVFPAADTIRAQMAQLKTDSIAPYANLALPSQLIPEQKMPAKGTIVKKRLLDNDVTAYTLSNGVRVLVKPTTFKEDEVTLFAKSQGGLSMVPKEQAMSARMATELVEVGGVGDFSAIQLEQYLAGKNVYTYTHLGQYVESFGGSSSKKDIETLFQLLYLTLNQPKQDTLAFQTYKTRYAAVLQSQDNSPMAAFQDTINATLNHQHPYISRFTLANLQQVDYQQAMQIFKERFANIADFSIALVGNVDVETIEPLLEQYIATLPASKKRESVAQKPLLEVPGQKTVRFTQPMQQPVTNVLIANGSKQCLNQRKEIAYNMLEAILDMVYVETVREEEGGTYGVGVRILAEKLPQSNAQLVISFQTDSAKVDRLLPIIYAELKKIAQEGPQASHLQKAKEYAQKAYTDRQILNSYWISRLTNTDMYGKDTEATYLSVLEKISARDIQKAAKNLLKAKHLKEVIQIGVMAN